MDNLAILLSKWAVLPVHYERDRKWALALPYSTAANRYTIVSPGILSVNVNNVGYAITSQVSLDLSVAANWDAIAPTDYTVAANRAGKDFYIYACLQAGSAPKPLLSANSTTPAGYTATNSRKVAGFHCLSVAVGAIAGHTLTGFVAGDVLPASIWDLKHKPREASPEGMVYSDQINAWVDIYLASGTGTATASVNGATISDTRTWNDFVDDGAAVKKRLLFDTEFQTIAAGSNEQTNIAGSADPVTTGGHVDTAARRMVSNIGCEDCCGVLWQWLDEQSYQFSGAANHTHQVTVSGDAETATTGNPSGDVAPAWAYKTLGGNKGQLYAQGTYGDVKLLAGAAWGRAAYSGSRARNANSYRWSACSDVGGRFAAEPL
jgi:hypothetical protein